MPNTFIMPKKKEQIRNLKATCDWYSKELFNVRQELNDLYMIVWNHGGKKARELAEKLEGSIR